MSAAKKKAPAKRSAAKPAPKPTTLATRRAAFLADKKAPQKSDIGAGVQPSTRVFTDWTPQRIRQAEVAADAGDLRYSAKLCDWILGDDRMGPLLHGRASSLLRITPTFEASGDGRKSGRVTKALDAQEDWFKAYPRSTSSLMLMWGILQGVSTARQGWPEDPETGRVLAKPEFWHPLHLRRDERTRNWITQVETPGKGVSDRVITPGDGEWIMYTPFGIERPWAMGLWRGLSRLCLMKALAIGDWARHSEKGAVIAVTSPPQAQNDGTSQAQRQQLAEELFARGREAVCALPPGYDIKLIETVANTQAIYDAQIQMVNTAAAVAIRGGNLTTETKGGSFAAAQQQSDNGDDVKLEFDGESWAETIHDQSLVFWAERNFGDKRLAPWPVFKQEKQEDLKGLADGARKMGFAASHLIHMGAVVDEAGATEMFRRFGLDGIFKAPNGLTAGPDPLTVTAAGGRSRVSAIEPGPDDTADPLQQAEEQATE